MHAATTQNISRKSIDCGSSLRTVTVTIMLTAIIAANAKG